jgi:aspartate racemase
MGGMHPEVANAFGQRLIQKKPGANDQEHARVLLDQAPVDPNSTVQASLQRLDRGGADIVAVTCETALGFFGDLQRTINNFGLKLEVLHIVDAAMAELKRQAPNATRIGLLATSVTLEAEVYEKRVAQNAPRKTWVYPSAETQAMLDDPGRYTPEERRDIFLAEAENLRNEGVEAILLACTEISQLPQTGDVKDAHGEDLPLIDTLDALAQHALERAEQTQSRLSTPSGCFDIAAEGLTSFVMSASALINGTPERQRRVGVIGGMGPAAAMQFSSYIVRFDDSAPADQQNVLMLLDQATDIPDRTGAILKGGRDPVPEMVASLKRLARAGADEVVMTCNTAHHFFPQVQEAIKREGLKVELIHIVDATMKLLQKRAPNAKKIGLLATTGTIKTGIYQEGAKGKEYGAEGPAWVFPDDETQEHAVMHGIYEGVKKGHNDMGRAALRAAADLLVAGGADAILLACTEIPLVLKTGDITNSAGEDVPLIDTLEALAHALIARSRVPVPATPGLVQQVCQWLAPHHTAASAEAMA